MKAYDYDYEYQQKMKSEIWPIQIICKLNIIYVTLIKIIKYEIININIFIKENKVSNI